MDIQILLILTSELRSDEVFTTNGFRYFVLTGGGLWSALKLPNFPVEFSQTVYSHKAKEHDCIVCY